MDLTNLILVYSQTFHRKENTLLGSANFMSRDGWLRWELDLDTKL